jgi:hypothetical protein
LVNSFKTDADGLPLFKTFNDVDVKNDQGLSVTAPFTPDAGTFDPRLDWTVGRRGITFLDWGVHTGAGYIRDQAYAGPYSPKKHLPYRSDIGINTGPNPRLNANNYRLIRYSHVLLMLAECEIEVGSLEKARELVNQIRRRAANPDGFVMASDGQPAANYVVKEYSAPWTDKVVAREATRFETRIELAMEGHRYFDLVRWGIADVTLNAYYAKEKEKRAYFNGVSFIKGRHEYYPIPLQEILNSKLAGKETLKQNPGY